MTVNEAMKAIRAGRIIPRPGEEAAYELARLLMGDHPESGAGIVLDLETGETARVAPPPKESEQN